MKIEVLSVPGCPHHAAAVAQVKRALADAALSAPVEERWVRDESEAEALRFCGSPTVRIDGRDVQAAAHKPGLACRLYGDGSGLPSQAALLRALAEAGRRGEG